MAEHPLVERVARDMFAVTDTGKTVDLADAPAIAQARYADFARAAIRAVLTWEPSEGMVKAGYYDALAEDARGTFISMNAALLRDVEGNNG